MKFFKVQIQTVASIGKSGECLTYYVSSSNHENVANEIYKRRRYLANIEVKEIAPLPTLKLLAILISEEPTIAKNVIFTN